MMRNKILAIITAGCLTASIGVTTFAFTKNVTSKTKVNYSAVQTMKQDNHQKDIKSNLDALVKAGTISQAIEDKVISTYSQLDVARKAEMDKLHAMSETDRKAYMDSQAKTQKTDPLAALVTDGTMTQAQEDAINSSIGHQGFHNGGMRGGMRGGNMQNNMKTELDALVKAGTITQATEDKVTAYQSQQQTARQAEMDKVKSMTEADRKAYFDSQAKTQKTDMFSDMVTKGVLTQAEVDAIKTASEANKQSMMKSQLNTLVTSGTITQAIEDSVVTALNKADADRKAEMDKIKAMSEVDRKTYLESQAKTSKTNPISSLVTSGTLTQAQADAINKVLPGHDGFGGHGGFDGHGGHGGFGGHGMNK